MLNEHGVATRMFNPAQTHALLSSARRTMWARRGCNGSLGCFFFHPGSWLKREKLARNSHEILWHVWESSPKFQYLAHEVMKCLAILGVLLSAVSLQNMLDKCTIVDYCGRSAKNFAEFPLHQHLAIAWPWGVSFSSSCATEGRKGSEAVSLNIGNGWNLVTFDIYDYWFMIYDAL